MLSCAFVTCLIYIGTQLDARDVHQNIVDFSHRIGGFLCTRYWTLCIFDGGGGVLTSSVSDNFARRILLHGIVIIFESLMFIDVVCWLTSQFNVQGSVRRKYVLIYIQQDATLHSLFISGNCSICFGWYLHPSSGAHATVSAASGTCQTVTTTCRYRGGVWTQFQLFHDSGR